MATEQPSPTDLALNLLRACGYDEQTAQRAIQELFQFIDAHRLIFMAQGPDINVPITRLQRNPNFAR